MIKIKAAGDKIIVELLKKVKTKGGLILPDGSMVDPQVYGRILTAGEDTPDNMKVGTYLVFHPQSGMDMCINKQILKVLKYDVDVWAILEDDEIKSQLEIILIGAATSESKIITANQGIFK